MVDGKSVAGNQQRNMIFLWMGEQKSSVMYVTCGA